jgi:hypothetical protein
LLANGDVHDLLRILKDGRLIAGCAHWAKYQCQLDLDEVEVTFVYFGLFEPNAKITRYSGKARESATLSWIFNLILMLEEVVEMYAQGYGLEILREVLLKYCLFCWYQGLRPPMSVVEATGGPWGTSI